MQRNMDLVRMILLQIESNSSGWAPPDFGIKGFLRVQIGYHAHIMKQEGLIEGCDVSNSHSAGPEVMPSSLTWKGHEFLDLARDQDERDLDRLLPPPQHLPDPEGQVEVGIDLLPDRLEIGRASCRERV